MAFSSDNITAIIEAILQFCGSIAWPFTLILITILFRDQVRVFIENLEYFKIGDSEFKRQEPDPDSSKSGGKIDTKINLFDRDGFLNTDGIKQLINDSEFTAQNEKVIDWLLLFRTKKQRTWLVTTSKQIFCILDDENTRDSGRLIQWFMKLKDASPIRAHISGRGNPVVDIGKKYNWLYSQSLHPQPTTLESNIEDMIKRSST